MINNNHNIRLRKIERAFLPLRGQMLSMNVTGRIHDRNYLFAKANLQQESEIALVKDLQH